MTSVPGHEPGGARAAEQLLKGARGGDSAAASALGGISAILGPDSAGTVAPSAEG